MQTGKSSITGPIIDRLHAEFDQIIVVGDSRISTENLYGDLTGAPLRGDAKARTCASIKQSDIGLVTDRKRIRGKVTVGSLFGIVRHLEDFPTGKRTLVILDEAYRTQAPSVQKILHHFGLADITNGEAHPPAKKSTGCLLIGYSGTAAGLDKYRVSARRTLLESIRAGEVRHMIGEQAEMKISSETRNSPDEGTMVWWEPTPENARELAKIYRDKIHGRYKRNMVNVPTIEHAKLMHDALQEICPDGEFGVVSSAQDEDDNHQALQVWENGGTVISIRKLARSFRGTATGAIFHTYQTQSEELFAQRTGRGWRQTGDLADLYVLEASWNGPMRFSNLARLLGLVDYPKHRVNTHTLERDLEHIKRQKNLDDDVNQKIAVGKISPVFSALPRIALWRDFIMQDILTDEASVAAMALVSGLPEVLLSGFRHGGLAYSVDQVRAVARAKSMDEDQLIQHWLDAWESVATEIAAGLRQKSDLPTWFAEWSRSQGNDASRAAALTRHLTKYIKDALKPKPPSIHWDWTPERRQQLHAILEEPQFAEFFKGLQSRFLGPPHTSYMGSVHGNIQAKETMRLRRWTLDRKRHLSTADEGLLAHLALLYASYQYQTLSHNEIIQKVAPESRTSSVYLPIADRLSDLLEASLHWDSPEALPHGRNRLLQFMRGSFLYFSPRLFFSYHGKSWTFATRHPEIYRWLITGQAPAGDFRSLLNASQKALREEMIGGGAQPDYSRIDDEVFYHTVVEEAGYPNFFAMGDPPLNDAPMMLEWIRNKALAEFIMDTYKALPLKDSESVVYARPPAKAWIREWLNGTRPL